MAGPGSSLPLWKGSVGCEDGGGGISRSMRGSDLTSPLTLARPSLTGGGGAQGRRTGRPSWPVWWGGRNKARLALLPRLAARSLLLLLLLAWTMTGQPSEPLRTLRVPGVVPFPTVRALGGGGLLRLMPLYAPFGRVGLAAHSTPDGVLTPRPDVVEAMALKAPHRLTLVRADVVAAPASQLQLFWWYSLVHHQYLSRGSSRPCPPEPRGGEHVRVCLYCLEGEVQGVALQHYLVPLNRWVQQYHSVVLLRAAPQEHRGRLVLRGEDVITY